MIKMVFGGVKGVDEPENAKFDGDVLLTFRPGERRLGLDVPLSAEARAVIATFFDRYHYLPGRTLSSVRLCPAPWCALWSFVDFSPPPQKLEPGVYSYKAPLADPLGLIIAAALAYWVENAGVKAVVEAYSNAWPRYCAALDALRSLKTQITIYTAYYDSRYICYDVLEVKHSQMDISRVPGPKTIQIEGRFIAPQVVDPAMDQAVLKLIRRVWESGGALKIGDVKKDFSERTIAEAMAMGLLTYSRFDTTLRITEGGIAALMAEESKGGAEESAEMVEEDLDLF